MIVHEILKLSGIVKTFGGVRALKGVELTVRPGEVHCLMGENGSGKSTLIKIISGVHPPDSGDIWMNGERVENASANEMIHRGVQVIYQDLSLLPNLTVAENIAFSRLARDAKTLIRPSEIQSIAATAMARIGARLDPDAIVGELPVGLQQMVAICRAFTGEVKLLVLDEPTASLTRAEIDNLLSVVRDMQARGIGVIFVSHKLDEVLEAADRATVLRDGRTVGSLDRAKLTHDALVELMTGRTVQQARFQPSPGPRRKILEVRGLSKRFNFADISFDLHEGEILGIAGLLGSGRTELALALFGINPADKGTIVVDGRPRRIASVQDAVRAGFAYVPESRLAEGLMLKKSVGENLLTTVIRRCVGPLGTIDPTKQSDLVAKWIRALQIKAASSDIGVQTLSGGNQQRVVIGKWLATDPRVLILDGPTVGVDIAAKASIHEIVRDLARRGAGVILISDEVPEVVVNSSRILLMRSGRIRRDIDARSVSAEEVQAMVEEAA
jgi:simple sugar transport system ATP-binding protein